MGLVLQGTRVQV